MINSLIEYFSATRTFCPVNLMESQRACGNFEKESPHIIGCECFHFTTIDIPLFKKIRLIIVFGDLCVKFHITIFKFLNI